MKNANLLRDGLSPHKHSEVSRFDYITWKTFLARYTSSAPFDSTTLKESNLNYRLPPSLWPGAEKNKYLAVSPFLQPFFISQSLRLHILRHGLRQVLKRRWLAPQNWSSVCPYECYSGVSRVGPGLQPCKDGQLHDSLILRNTWKGQSSRLFGSGGSGDACSSPTAFFKNLGAPSLFHQETLKELYNLM